MPRFDNRGPAPYRPDQEDDEGYGKRARREPPPIASNRNKASTLPTFRTFKNEQTGRRELEITHRECLGDVLPTTAAFTTHFRVNLNPGLRTVTPIGSCFAANFSEYKYESVVIEYVTGIPEGTPNVGGVLLMMAGQNPAEAGQFSKKGMENTDHVVSKTPLWSTKLPVPCDENWRFIRRDGEALTDDLGNYDAGFVQVATDGVTPGLTTGSIFMSYTVRVAQMRLTIGHIKPDITLDYNQNTNIVSGATILNTTKVTAHEAGTPDDFVTRATFTTTTPLTDLAAGIGAWIGPPTGTIFEPDVGNDTWVDTLNGAPAVSTFCPALAVAGSTVAISNYDLADFDTENDVLDYRVRASVDNGLGGHNDFTFTRAGVGTTDNADGPGVPMSLLLQYRPPTVTDIVQNATTIPTPGTAGTEVFRTVSTLKARNGSGGLKSATSTITTNTLVDSILPIPTVVRTANPAATIVGSNVRYSTSAQARNGVGTLTSASTTFANTDTALSTLTTGLNAWAGAPTAVRSTVLATMPSYVYHNSSGFGPKRISLTETVVAGNGLLGVTTDRLQPVIYVTADPDPQYEPDPGTGIAPVGLAAKRIDGWPGVLSTRTDTAPDTSTTGATVSTLDPVFLTGTGESAKLRSNQEITVVDPLGGPDDVRKFATETALRASSAPTALATAISTWAGAPTGTIVAGTAGTQESRTYDATGTKGINVTARVTAGNGLLGGSASYNLVSVPTKVHGGNTTGWPNPTIVRWDTTSDTLTSGTTIGSGTCPIFRMGTAGSAGEKLRSNMYFTVTDGFDRNGSGERFSQEILANTLIPAPTLTIDSALTLVQSTGGTIGNNGTSIPYDTQYGGFMTASITMKAQNVVGNNSVTDPPYKTDLILYAPIGNLVSIARNNQDTPFGTTGFFPQTPPANIAPEFYGCAIGGGTAVNDASSAQARPLSVFYPYADWSMNVANPLYGQRYFQTTSGTFVTVAEHTMDRGVSVIPNSNFSHVFIWPAAAAHNYVVVARFRFTVLYGWVPFRSTSGTAPFGTVGVPGPFGGLKCVCQGLQLQSGVTTADRLENNSPIATNFTRVNRSPGDTTLLYNGSGGAANGGDGNTGGYTNYTMNPNAGAGAVSGEPAGTTYESEVRFRLVATQYGTTMSTSYNRVRLEFFAAHFPNDAYWDTAGMNAVMSPAAGSTHPNFSMASTSVTRWESMSLRIERVT